MTRSPLFITIPYAGIFCIQKLTNSNISLADYLKMKNDNLKNKQTDQQKKSESTKIQNRLTTTFL